MTSGIRRTTPSSACEPDTAVPTTSMSGHLDNQWRTRVAKATASSHISTRTICLRVSGVAGRGWVPPKTWFQPRSVQGIEHLRDHAPENASQEADEIAWFHHRCSDLMRAVLDALAAGLCEPRPFGVVEDLIGWPRRRISSVLGGVAHLRRTEFGGRRPYRFLGDRDSASGRWEIWMDERQAAAVRRELS